MLFAHVREQVNKTIWVKFGAGYDDITHNKDNAVDT